MLKNTMYMLLGATLLAAAGYGTYHFGDFLLLSADERNSLFMEVMMAIEAAKQFGYEACKNGL